MLTTMTYSIKPLCVLLFGVDVALGITAKWRVRIMNEFGNVTVNPSRVDRVIREIPMVGKRFAIMRVERFII